MILSKCLVLQWNTKEYKGNDCIEYVQLGKKIKLMYQIIRSTAAFEQIHVL